MNKVTLVELTADWKDDEYDLKPGYLVLHVSSGTLHLVLKDHSDYPDIVTTIVVGRPMCKTSIFKDIRRESRTEWRHFPVIKENKRNKSKTD